MSAIKTFEELRGCRFVERRADPAGLTEEDGTYVVVWSDDEEADLIQVRPSRESWDEAMVKGRRRGFQHYLVTSLHFEPDMWWAVDPPRADILDRLDHLSRRPTHRSSFGFFRFRQLEPCATLKTHLLSTCAQAYSELKRSGCPNDLIEGALLAVDRAHESRAADKTEPTPEEGG